MLGRKAAKRPDEDDDALDDLLDGFEAKRGLESSKREEEALLAKARPKTAAVKENLWGGDAAESLLDDLDDGGAGPPETSSQRGPTDDARAAKRRALFGGAGASGS